MASGTRFTDKFIRSLKPESKEYWKREGQGFCIRVYPSGEKAWYYVYTFEGRKRFMRLGDGGYPDVSLATAREKFDIARVKAKNGLDPLAEQDNTRIERSRVPSVASFVREYINRYAKTHNRSWREIERALEASVIPAWKDRKITDIRRRDLVVILDEIVDRGAPVMANRVLAYTRKLFSYAVKRDVLEVNPFLGMDRPAKEKARERTLSAHEIKTLWENLDKTTMGESVRRALKLILVTAQRPGEVIGMHRGEIEGNWWNIPAERSKNGQAHRVFLTPLALELIGDEDGYIFESPTYPGNDAAGNSLPAKPYQTRTMTAGIKANLPHTPESTVEDRLGIAHFTPHDLRRTAATGMAEIGIPGDILDRVQNHITREKQGVGHVYNRYSYDREKQLALEAWERKLKSILTGKQGNVVPFVRRPADP